jgi:hypothetical protein
LMEASAIALNPMMKAMKRIQLMDKKFCFFMIEN